MSVAVPGTRKDRIGRFARAALKQALGVVTGDRRLEAEGSAEREAERRAEPESEAGSGAAAARPRRRGGRSLAEGSLAEGSPAERRDAR